MKFYTVIFFSILSISCFSQNDSLKIKKDNRFKVAGSVLADSFLSVPGDFSAMGHTISSDWKRTAIYTAGIIGLIAVDKQTTGFLHDHIEPNIDYSLPKIKSTIPHVIGTDSYIVYPIIGLYAGSLIINNKKGQVVAVNAVKSLAYSYVITQIVLKTISSRNRPQRKINDDNPVVEPWTKNPWDFGNFHHIHLTHGGSGTSFPSFHSTSYFAVAKVFQMEYNNYWIPYTFVTVVFLSNIKSHDHWVSDLLVGGLVGTIIGRSIVISSRKQIAKNESSAFNDNPKKFKMHKQLIPQISNSMIGLHFIGTF
ncbi:phosphatase PAP2 family protein [Flavobacterium sp. ANB]|uniref:phosphatase PAP2 family protein n=1 Tax=unclassified Flavobacterium TaxID=196869 RepID=UPI0012B75CA7|nr:MULTISPECIES: phosphatase PAP2 family protein [unclassified Flavobacterium]MBF4516206.1 phosphatase PAP2 family protein [Flavobacterium sp. ANB]MTD69897.1 phosphatase PAP2 family protein [Flavobacterium sp. LC2016-13]